MGNKRPKHPKQTRAQVIFKVRENRLRRGLDRRGLMLHKSRRRDPMALDYGHYSIISLATSAVVAEGLRSLEDIEKWMGIKKGGKR